MLSCVPTNALNDSNSIPALAVLIVVPVVHGPTILISLKLLILQLCNLIAGCAVATVAIVNPSKWILFAWFNVVLVLSLA